MNKIGKPNFELKPQSHTWRNIFREEREPDIPFGKKSTSGFGKLSGGCVKLKCWAKNSGAYSMENSTLCRAKTI